MPEDESIAERLTRIEKLLDAFGARLSALEEAVRSGTAPRAAAEPSREETLLRNRVAALEAEKIALSDRIRTLAEGRLQASPEQVTLGFRKAIEALQGGLAPKPGDRMAYTVSEMQVGLKSLVALDDAGGLRFVLPTPEERFDPAQITEVRFTLRASAEAATALPGLVPVPSLLGLPRAAAETALARAGLKLGQVAEQESRYPVGTVIGQAPDPGDEVAPEVPIEIVVAVAIKPTVPDLRGLTVEEATARIEALGLVPGKVEKRESADTEEGRVLTHEPLAGTRVDPGSEVSLVVAVAPPPTVAVPDLTGMPREEAARTLKSAGLGVGEVTEKENGRPGLVLAQAPKPGSPVPPGSAVSLVVSAEIGVRDLIERAVKAAAGTRTGISGKLLRERLTALELKDYAAFEALAASPLEELQKAIGAPTPRGLQDAKAALRKALEGESGDR